MPTASFLKLMRLGWRNGFQEEQAKLKRKLRLPDWDSVPLRPKDGPLWSDRSTSFKEKEKERAAQEKEKEKGRRPSTARKPLGPAWDKSIHQANKHGSLWEDNAISFKEMEQQRQAERRKEMESFRSARVSARGLRGRAEL